ncbi:MAG: protein-tyrosine-phosphatase [Bacillales bacterium]|nr:protein-tyrosine-phosphatase [Bacillales bacterium]
MASRRVLLKNVSNMRDLGGYATEDGHLTQFGRFYRSNVPAILSEEEVDYLKGVGIQTIIDLRTTSEVERVPNQLSTDDFFDYVHVSVMDGDIDKLPETAEAIPYSYLAMADNHEKMEEIFKILALSKGAAMFHCTAGKDRTGVVAALLLSLAGVGLEDILADYQVTHTYIRKELKEMTRHHGDNLPWFIGRSDIEFMYGFLVMFQEKYRNVSKYLQSIGLSEGEIFLLKNKLLNNRLFDKQQFFFKITPLRPTFAEDMTEDEEEIMDEHFFYWKELFDNGKVISIGPVFGKEGAFGIGLFECENLDEAEKLVGDDPSVKCGLQKPEVHPMRISLHR